MYKPNLLLSYAYFSNTKTTLKNLAVLKKYRKYVGKIILDSGAYTFYNQGKVVNPIVHTESMLHIKEDLDIEFLVQLDAIKNPEVTRMNYEFQKDLGFCPVITTGQKLSEIDDPGTKVFMGSINRGDITKDQIIKLAWAASKHFKDFHLLGVMSPYILNKIPPCSVDASSPTISLATGGNVYLYQGDLDNISRYLKPVRDRIEDKDEEVMRFCCQYDLMDIYEQLQKEKKVRFPFAIYKMHIFSYLLYSYELYKARKVEVYHVLSPQAKNYFMTYMWALWEIKNGNKAFA